jgi:excisionase family DNA binding protein
VNKRTNVPSLLNIHGTAHFKCVNRPLLDVEAAAHRLGCSERFIRRLVQERRIPFVKLGGTMVRFVDADLDRWIVAQRIEVKR